VWSNLPSTLCDSSLSRAASEESSFQTVMNITRHRTAVVASCNSGAACKCHDVLTYLVKANVPGCQHCTSAYLVCSVCAICISDVHTMFRDQCVTCCGRTLMIELAGASHRVEPATHLARTSQRHSLTPTSSS